MTVYQEAHTRIDQLPEETVLLFIQLMDKMSPNVIEKEKKNKNGFLASAGKIDIDGHAISQLREASMI
jgi:hypothetical protein